MRLGTIDNRARRILDHNRCLTLVITTAGLRYHHQQSHSVGGITAISNILFTISIHWPPTAIMYLKKLGPSQNYNGRTQSRDRYSNFNPVVRLLIKFVNPFLFLLIDSSMTT
jgi:hypothetical protein